MMYRHFDLIVALLRRKPVDLSPGVAEDDSLRDGNGLVQVGKRVQLPVLFLGSHVELFNTRKRELGLLDKDTGRLEQMEIYLKHVSSRPHPQVRHVLVIQSGGGTFGLDFAGMVKVLPQVVRRFDVVLEPGLAKSDF